MGMMTVSSDRRVRQNLNVFREVNYKQHQQDKVDRLKFIKNCVAEYNSRLIDGEPKITITEMLEQVSRKAEI
jgi:hypothetical protein